MSLFSGRSRALALCFFYSVAWLFSAFMAVFIFPCRAEAKVPHVLILNSYSDVFPWTGNLDKNIISTFDTEGREAEFFIDFLDSKRFFYPGYMKELADIFRQKYAHRTFDLTIAVDDNAFSFLSIYGNTLFRGVPLLFLGVNDTTFLRDHLSPSMTGMVENIDIRGTVDLALSVHPLANRLVLISDFTKTGINHIEKFWEIRPTLPSDLEVTEFLGLDRKELEGRLRMLDRSSIILFFSYFRDGSGRSYSLSQVRNILKSAGSVPVYSFWDFMVSPPDGAVLGGKVISSPSYGHDAAEMAIAIIDGKPVSEIPIVWHGPSAFPCFNYRLLGKYGLSGDRLPKGAVRFNVPQSFLHSHKRMVFANIIFLMFLMGLIVFLAFNMYVRKKTEKALSKEKKYWESLFKHSPEAMVLTDLKGIIHKTNGKFRNLFGYSMSETEGKSLDSLFSRSRDQFREATSVSRKVNSGQQVHLETSRITKGGREIPVSITGIPLSVDGERIAAFTIYRDITEQKRSDEELEHRLRFEEILSRESSRLVFVKNMDEVVPKVLEEIRRFLNCSCIVLGRIDRSSGTLDIKYETRVRGIPSMKDMDIALCDISTILRDLRTKGKFILQDVFSMGGPASFFSVLAEKRQVRSLLALPLNMRSDIEGMMVFENLWTERGWNDYDLSLLQTFCDILGEAFRRQDASDKLRSTMADLRKAFDGTFNMMTKILEIKDPYTAGHQQKVTQLAVAIALEMDLPAEKIDAVYYSSLIHDIGKINIPSEILSKPGKLTELEFALIKNHALYGWEILHDIYFPWPIAEIVLQHHERINGSGYPSGLKDGEIFLEAKILTVADVVEAMASDRPYRPSLGIEEALAEIKKNRGILYMPEAVDTCLALFGDERFVFREPVQL